MKLLSNEQVTGQSVNEVLYGKITNVESDILDNTLYAPKMGTIENGKLCATCFLDFTKCKGHFGYIVLGDPLVNPIVKKQFKWVTQHLCRNCRRVIITKNHLKLNDIKYYKPSSTYIEKVSCCFHCSYPKEPYNIETELNIIKTRLEELCKEDVKVFNFQGSYPKDFILRNFSIIPTCTRPY